MLSRRDFIAALAVLAGSRAVCGQPAQGIIAAPGLTGPAASANAFDADLYALLGAEKKGENLFFSPYSIHVALAMTAAGARANTLAQMAKVLHLGEANAETHAGIGKLMQQINASAQGPKGQLFELVVANRLWGLKGYPYHADFLDLLKKEYGADLEAVNFADSEPARRTINAWVEKQTKDKIKDLIPQGAIDALTRLVLTNAVYFKGNWADQFKPDMTKTEPFKLGGEKTVDAPLMQRRGTYGFRESDEMQVLELPYTDNRLSMFVLLPRQVEGLAGVEKQINGELLNKSLARIPRRQVQVFLPKFKLESSFSLPGVLKKLGMTDAFDDTKADLSGIATVEKGLYITDVVHKAYVDVNEEGTEAAAATGVIVGVKSAPMQPAVFRADHPFAFLIRHNASGAVLFQGRVCNPKA